MDLRSHLTAVRALAALALVLPGCRTQPATSLALAVEPRDVAVGDTVRLTMTVTNAHADTVRLAFEPGCRAAFSVRHAAERWAAHPVPDPCTAVPRGDSSIVVLAPGGVWREVHAWVVRTEDPGRPLVPGRYVASVALAQRAELRGARRVLQLGTSSPETPVHVRPAP